MEKTEILRPYQSRLSSNKTERNSFWSLEDEHANIALPIVPWTYKKHNAEKENYQWHAFMLLNLIRAQHES
jgi:hypothetical protein